MTPVRIVSPNEAFSLEIPADLAGTSQHPRIGSRGIIRRVADAVRALFSSRYVYADTDADADYDDAEYDHADDYADYADYYCQAHMPAPAMSSMPDHHETWNAPMKYLNTQEAAALLGLAPATLDNWRSLQKGPPYRKFSNRVRYEAEALEAWAASQPGSAHEVALT